MADDGGAVRREENDEETRVAAALATLESAVRQRHAQLATLAGERESVRLQLLELRSAELLQEPHPVSPRPVIGRSLVFLRRAVYHLFGKWIVRPIVQQQNRFNQSVRRLLVEQDEVIRRLAGEIEQLQRRLEGSDERAE